jgi:hypothetical protein
LTTLSYSLTEPARRSPVERPDAAGGIAYASTQGEGKTFTTSELKINSSLTGLETRFRYESRIVKRDKAVALVGTQAAQRDPCGDSAPWICSSSSQYRKTIGSRDPVPRVQIPIQAGVEKKICNG